MQPPPPPPPLPPPGSSSLHGHRRGFEASPPEASSRPVQQQQQQLDPRLAGPSTMPAAAATSSSASPSSSSSKPIPKVSCLECRSSKVKCLPQSENDPPGHPCARCQRLSKSCVYEKHKRGRKPDSVKYGKLEKQLETLLSELREEKAKSANRKSGGGAKAGKAAQQQDHDEEEEDDQDYYDEDEEGEDGPAAKRLRAETAEILTNWSANSSTASPSLSSSRQKRSAPGTSTPAGMISSTGEDTLPEAGAPLLSNPLKLLAQASAGDDDEDVVTGTTSCPTTAAGAGESIGPSSPPLRPSAGPAPTLRRPRDRLGLYDAKPEVGPHLDPITVGHVSLSSARHLWLFFLDKLSHPLILLDRSLYTFDYTRPRSAMLLSVGLALAARLVPSTPSLRTDEIAERIDQHVLHTIIPVVLLEGKRSIHCVKAFLLLAAYNGQSIPLTQDRSFSYVTSAFSMCVELDLNCKMVSTSADQEDEMLQRKLRERERTYFLAWTYFFSICLHHGRHCSLSIHDRVVAASNDWHTSKFALPEDAGLVSNLQLRKLISRNLDYYHQHVAPLMPKCATDGPPDEACRLLLDFHRKSINEDLDQWHAQWVLPQAAKAAGSSGDVDTTHAPLRLQSTAFYHSYATLILHALPLRCGSLTSGGTSSAPAHSSAPGGPATVDEVLAPFRRKADEAALSCVALFLRFSRDQLLYGHNSSHVTVGFAAVHALRAPYHSAAASVEGQSAEDKGDEVLGMVKRVVERMEEAGRVTEHRKAFSTGYAVFLRKLVAIHEMRSRQRRGTAAVGTAQEGTATTATAAAAEKAGSSTMAATTAATTRGRRKRGETTSGRPSSSSGGAGVEAAMHSAPGSTMMAQPSSSSSSMPALAGRSSSAHAIPTLSGQGTFDYSHQSNGGYPPTTTTSSSSSGMAAASFSSPSILSSHNNGISPSLAHHHSNNGSSSTSFFDVPGSSSSGSYPFDPTTTSSFNAPGTGSGSTASLLDELLMAQPLGLQFDSWLDDLGVGGTGAAGGFFNGGGGGGGAGGYTAGGGTVDDGNGHGYYASAGNGNGNGNGA